MYSFLAIASCSIEAMQSRKDNKKTKFTFDLVFDFEIHFEFDFEFDFLRWQERLLVFTKLLTASETICKGC